MKFALLLALALPFALRGCLERSPTVTITAPAKFERRPTSISSPGDDFSYVYLRIFSGTRSYDVYWGLDWGDHAMSFFPVELAADKEYDFTLAQEPPTSEDDVDGNFPVPHIVRIVQWPHFAGGPVLYDREICEVHHCRMKRSELPIAYGMLATLYTADEFKTLFPHSQKFVAGGCIAGDRKTDLIFVCPQCGKAYANWLKIHARRAYERE